MITRSTIDYTILRPTIVLGTGSPIGEMLAKIAGLPVIPAIGGGHNIVQPVSVDDVAAAIRAILALPGNQASTIEFGGTESLPFRELLQQFRTAGTGNKGLVMPIPVWPIRLMLSLLKPILGSALPISAGQLTPFVNDGRAEESEFAANFDYRTASLAQMLAASRPAEAPLDAECRVFVRYLTGRVADDYVVRKYRELHDTMQGRLSTPGDTDARLIRFARKGAFRAQIADCFARRFLPNGLLRQKLAVLVAILENSPQHFAGMTHGNTRSLAIALLLMTFAGIRWAVATVLALFFFLPRHLASDKS